MILNKSCVRCRRLIRVAAPPYLDPTTDSYCVDHLADLTEVDRLTAAFLAAVEHGEASAADALALTVDQAQRAAQGSVGGSAVAYAGHGWPVFPVAEGGKVPATKNGFRDATTNEDQIREWWRRNPNFNIGVATGHTFDVIDIDHRAPGTAIRWADLKDTDIEVEALVSTPRGIHAYVMPTGKGNMAKVAGMAGIDYRGKGGYVVAPPSSRPDGHYAWSSKPSPRIL